MRGISSQGLLEQLKASCERIADCIEDRQPEAQITQALERTLAVCERSSANEQPSDVKTLVTHLKTAVETWYKVWPRLGRQAEFRLAVVREARVWARRL